MNTRLVLGDCIEEMSKMGEGVVDLTVTSPPYDNLRSYNKTLEWGEHIWRKVIAKLYNVTAEGGVVVWIVNDATIKGSETATSFKQALYAMECGFNLHDTMIWVKDGGGAVGSNKCYAQNFEYMFIFSKGRIKTCNLLRDKINKSAGQDKSGIGRLNANEQYKIEKRKVGREYSKRNNYWYVPPQKGKGHPACFPEQLVHDHVRTWSNAGDLVFDPFLGSGTTGVVCKNLNREFIGIEKVEKYFEIAKKRIDETSLHDDKFAPSCKQHSETQNMDTPTTNPLDKGPTMTIEASLERMATVLEKNTEAINTLTSKLEALQLAEETPEATTKAKPKAKPKAKAKPKKGAASVEETPEPVAEDAPETTTESEYTPEDIRMMGKALLAAGKKKEYRAALASMQLESGSSATAEQRPELVGLLEKILGKTLDQLKD